MLRARGGNGQPDCGEFPGLNHSACASLRKRQPGVGQWTRSGPADQASSTAEQPRQILERRLANGEIDVETYDALREKLRLTH